MYFSLAHVPSPLIGVPSFLYFRAFRRYNSELCLEDIPRDVKVVVALADCDEIVNTPRIDRAIDLHNTRQGRFRGKNHLKGRGPRGLHHQSRKVVRHSSCDGEGRITNPQRRIIEKINHYITLHLKLSWEIIYVFLSARLINILHLKDV